MSDIKHLIVKNPVESGRSKVYPHTYIEAIRDKYTGESLLDILRTYNNLLLVYAGTPEFTRLQVNRNLRRKGLWITYVDYNKIITTEYYIGDSIEDDVFKDTSNWKTSSDVVLDGLTISPEGTWVINGVDTGVQATGESAYDQAVRGGYTGTLEEFEKALAGLGKLKEDRMTFDLQGDNMVAEGETKTIQAIVLDNYNINMNYNYTNWTITRQTGNEHSDNIWNANAKIVDGLFQISWTRESDDFSGNNAALFIVTATRIVDNKKLTNKIIL